MSKSDNHVDSLETILEPWIGHRDCDDACNEKWDGDQLIRQIEDFYRNKILEARKLAPNVLSELTYTIDMLTTGDRKTAIHPTQQKLVDELLNKEQEFVEDITAQFNRGDSNE